MRCPLKRFSKKQKAVSDMFYKPERIVRRVFIHCSATDNADHDDVSVIRQWHLEKGWKDVGYHFFINKDGTIQTGRDIEKTPAAQYGHNQNTIAICLHGLTKSKFAKAQKAALKELCNDINLSYKKITFHGHKEVNSNKTCPVIDYVSILGLDPNGFMKGA